MKTLVASELTQAMDGSYYTIRGVGGPIGEWLTGYEKMLADSEIGKPQEWFRTTGADVNLFAIRRKKGLIKQEDQFPDDLVFLMFPLDGLHIGSLAALKLRMGDIWFDDMIQNMS